MKEHASAMCVNRIAFRVVPYPLGIKCFLLLCHIHRASGEQNGKEKQMIKFLFVRIHGPFFKIMPKSKTNSAIKRGSFSYLKGRNPYSQGFTEKFP